MTEGPEGKDAARAVWGATPAGFAFGAGAEPGTKAFFDAARGRRSTYEQPWLTRVVPFSSFRARRVLELGCGAGFDAFEFERAGALYTGIDIASENIDRASRHLAFYGYHPEFEVGDAESLRFDDATFDVVYSNGVLHHTPDISASFSEARRVLRTGGEFWVIVYHRTSIAYWVSLFSYNWLLRGGFLKRSFQDQVRSIEVTSAATLPIVNTYTRRELTSLLQEAGFEVRQTWVRKLVHEDLPGGRRLFRRVPQRWLDRIGKKWGWYVIARSRKPTG